MHKVEVATTLLIILVMTACGSTASSGVGRDVPVPSPISRIASTPEWQQEGQRLRDFKRQMNVQHPNGPGHCGASPLPCNAADFAYQSNPVDIVGPGVYTFRFGPVAPDFEYPRSPIALTYEFPSDMSFQLAFRPDLTVSIVTIGGQRFLDEAFEVLDFRAGYPGFTVWIY